MSTPTIDLAAMRRADARVGVPLCRLLTWARRLRLIRDAPAGPPKRMLVIKLAEQGATVAAAPALRRAVEMVGVENVYVAVFAQNRFVLDQLGIVAPENVLTVRTTSGPRALLDLVRLARRARRLGIDSTADLEFFARSSAIVAALSGAGRRAGLHSFSGEGPFRGDLLTHRIGANPLQHVSHTFRAIVEALGQPTDALPALDVGPWPLEPPPSVHVEPKELTAVRGLVDRLLPDLDGPIVLLNPNAGDLVPLRRWPDDRYVALAEAILERVPGAGVLITGSPEEAAAAAAVASRVDSVRCASIAGQTSLRELLVLYTLSDVLVTNDSGPAHYSTLTPIEVVVLFGPESPQVFGPTGPRVQVQWAELPCSPCVNAFNNRESPCRNNVCMQRITVDDVLGDVLAAIERRS